MATVHASEATALEIEPAERRKVRENSALTIVEVWHGGIPSSGTPRLPLCVSAACPMRGAHSHTQRISDKPFSIPWQSYIKHHITRQPDVVVHVFPNGAA